jgi:hypothetical protein
MGAIFVGSVPARFGDDAKAGQVARSPLDAQVAVCDRSDWGRLEISGRDRLTFLHNQSTNDFNRLQPGQGGDTVIVTSTARTIDLATAYILPETILMIVSPNRRQQVLTWLDRYIFFGDQVKLTDVTAQTVMFSLVGAASHALLETLGAGAIVGQPEASHQVWAIAGAEVRVAVGSGLAIDGYTLIMKTDDGAAVWQALVQAGAALIGTKTWEQWRIQQGRPMPDSELTEDYNPLEAGLWQTISFNKGCYIGQETIARLDTYKGVKQQLWGVKLAAIAQPGTTITIGEAKVGILTSVTETDAGYVGLAYIRTKAGGAGLQVQVGEVLGEIVDVPFLQRDRAVDLAT